MDARNDPGICTVKRERDFPLRPLQRKGRDSQQGGTADNSKHAELFHDRSPWRYRDGDAAHRPPSSQRTATLSSRYLARRYRLYAEPRPAPTCGLVLMNSSSVSLSTERVCSEPSQFGNVLAVNFSVKVCFSSSTV